MIVLFSMALAQDATPDEDPLELAALLIGDGFWERAEVVLDGIEEPDDPVRFHTLRGTVHLHDEEWTAAADHLQTAIDLGGQDPTLWMRLGYAQTNFDVPAAYDTVSAAPDYNGRTKQLALILCELGLYQEALALDIGDDLDARRVIAEAMHRGGQTERAIEMLEQARLMAPEDVELSAHLARLYVAADRPLAAGQVLMIAAEQDPALFADAVECYRMGGQIDRALLLNARVQDPVIKTRQRLGLLLVSEQWERAAALEPRAERLGLLEEDEVRYGLAYAFFMMGDHTTADELLDGIRDPRIFEDATRLRQAMERES